MRLIVALLFFFCTSSLGFAANVRSISEVNQGNSLKQGTQVKRSSVKSIDEVNQYDNLAGGSQMRQPHVKNSDKVNQDQESLPEEQATPVEQSDKKSS